MEERIAALEKTVAELEKAVRREMDRRPLTIVEILKSWGLPGGGGGLADRLLCAARDVAGARSKPMTFGRRRQMFNLLAKTIEKELIKMNKQT